MIISVALLPKLLPADWTHCQPAAIVIDTLRFTSTACVALAAGARGVTVVSDIQRAKRLAQDFSGSALLCGERACVRIPGFDLGNSPAEYTPQSVAGRELIFSTTNGTVAVEAAQGARSLVLGSLLNRAALGAWLGQLATEPRHNAQPLHVWCVCAGTDGEVALEDVLTAGAIIDGLLSQSSGWRLGNDASHLALEAWQRIDQADSGNSTAGETVSPALLDRFARAAGGRNLLESGFADDLRLVARLDSLNAIPHQQSPLRFTLAR